MPEIKQIPNPLYGHHQAGCAGALISPTTTSVQFADGELNEAECEHARLTARVNFGQLVQIAEKMQQLDITYTQALNHIKAENR